MPVIGIGVEALRKRLGIDLAGERLLRVLEEIGCDVEGFARLSRTRCARCGWIDERTSTEDPPATCDGCSCDHRAEPKSLDDLPVLEVVRMELLAVRPDMFDPAGLARALRGYLGVETGLPRYAVGSEAAVVRVDASVRDPKSLRPHIACAVVEGLSLDQDSLKVLMKLQENLHWALGRDRKLASIGVYDFDSIAPEIEYTTEDPDQYRFVPLGAPADSDPWILRRILNEHPKGRAYRHLLEAHDRYPILRDKNGSVLSMPPIINSEATRVRPETRRLFIDVTGLGPRVVGRALHILTTALLELLPDASCRSVRLLDAARPDGEGVCEEPLLSPDLTPQQTILHAGVASRLLGIAFRAEEAGDLLRRMRHDARIVDDDRIEVDVAAYRNDILHERDLMEDLAIAYGYHQITPRLLPARTVGQARSMETASNSVREAMTGLGFLEVLTLILTSDDEHDAALGREADEQSVRIENPISGEQTRLRTSLLPGLLQVFRHNLHQPLPQRIFEVGDVTLLDPEAETGATEHRLLAFGIVGPKAGFTDARSLVDAVGREFGVRLAWETAAKPPFLAGRCARLSLAEQTIGFCGEVDPEVLVRFGLENPAVLAELMLDPLFGRPPRRAFSLDD